MFGGSLLVRSSSSFLSVNPGAIAAYSLRDLRNSNQPVVRVRRSSDNVESDFGASQILNGSLAAWVGASNGFVTVLYDQLSVNDLSQSTFANQPQIVSNGSVMSLNGNPYLAFDGINDSVVSASTLPLESSSFFSGVWQIPQVADGTFRTVFEMANAWRVTSNLSFLDGLAFIAWNDASTTTIVPSQNVEHSTTTNVSSIAWNGGANNNKDSYTFWRDVVSVEIGQGGGISGMGRVSAMAIGSRGNSTGYTQLNFQELILFGANLNQDRRLPIMENQKLYYNI